MKQTAVQWLVEQITYATSEGVVISYHKDITQLVEQAKEMEKEQIINTWYDCKMSIIERNPTTADQYYNETYEAQND